MTSPEGRSEATRETDSVDVVNPATESVLRSIELLDVEAVDDAVAKALSAQREWAALTPSGRAAALRAFAGVVDAHVDELARLEVANSGHPIGSAESEARHVSKVLEYYAASPERLSGKQIPVAGGLDVTFAEPIGVVGVITPWNFPMTIAAWGFAPALAAGNAVVVKPAEWTPLTTIRGTVELLQEHFDSMSQQERERFLHNLEAEAERLARLVTRLLDLARADVAHGADRATTHAAELISRVAERYRKEGLAVDATVSEVLTIAIAEEALEMILINLIENASQHAGPQAHVTISLRKQGDEAALAVSDDGPGISSANVTHIFTPFFTTARKHGGTGLGLSIVQALARVHSGSVVLLPSTNGATFEVRLPLAA